MNKEEESNCIEFIENVGVDKTTLVTLESAKKLKEEGFNKPSHYFYLDKDDLPGVNKGLKRVKYGERRMNHNNTDAFIYSAPTKEELESWKN